MKIFKKSYVLLIMTGLLLSNLAFSQGIVKVIGDQVDNHFNTTKMVGNDFYAVGYTGDLNNQNITGTFAKLDDEGNVLCSVSLPFLSQLMDFVEIPGTGEILAIGRTEPLNIGGVWQDNQSVVCRINANCQILWSRTYEMDANGRETFAKILYNPNSAALPYFIAGVINNTSTPSSFDDIIVVNMDENGNETPFASHLSVGSDNEFIRSFKVLPTGEMVLTGNQGTQSSMVFLNNAGFFSGNAYEFSNLWTIDDAIYNGSETYLVGMTNQSGAYISKRTTASTGFQEVYTFWLPEVHRFVQILEYNGFLYVVAEYDGLSGVRRSVVFKFQDVGNSLNYFGAYYLENGDSDFNRGHLTLNYTAGLAYVDSRSGGNDVLGDFDVMIGLVDEDFTSCITEFLDIGGEFIETFGASVEVENQEFFIPEPVISEEIKQEEFQQINVCDCGEIITSTIECKDDFSYDVDLQFVNNTNYLVTYVLIQANNATPAGTTITPFSFPGINIPGPGTSATQTVNIKPPASMLPLTSPLTVCFPVTYLNSENEECCFFEKCIELPVCDPCDSIDVVSTPIVSDSTENDCCYSIDLVNNFAPNFFTKINANLLTPGVVFTNPQVIGGWNMTASATNLMIEPQGINPHVPMGTTTDAFSFCFDNITSPSQVPQTVVYDWMAIDPLTGEEYVACSDTIMYDCEPCLYIYENEVICEPDGSYSYNFTAQNNVGFTASYLTLQAYSPAGVSFNPSTIFGPFPPNTPISVNVDLLGTSGLPAGTSIKFKATLIEGDWCCHLDTICIELPDCDPNMDCIDSTLIDPSAICPFVFQPVCGCNDVTYFNDCVATNFAGVTSWTPGICFTNNPPPPFDLVAETINNAAILLNWDIEDDETQLFLIQRKAPDGDWETIAEVEGTGAGMYEYLDESPLDETNIYQIIAGQPDGAALFSNEAEGFIENEPPVVIFPNPAVEYVQMKVEKRVENSGLTTARLVSAMGEVAAVKTLQAGQLDYKFDVAGLSPGLYFIYLEKANGETEKIPFVIERSR